MCAFSLMCKPHEHMHLVVVNVCPFHTHAMWRRCLRLIVAARIIRFIISTGAMDMSLQPIMQ